MQSNRNPAPDTAPTFLSRLFATSDTSDNATSPADFQRRTQLRFPLAVQQSSLHLWKPGDPIATSPIRLIVGAATYSFVDMRTLDRLDIAARLHSDALWVDVFNTLDCPTHEAYVQYVPNLGNVYQTPVVGCWQNGIFAQSASGKPAMDQIEALIARLKPS